MQQFIIVNEDRGLGKLWSRVIRDAGYKARIFERPGDLYQDFIPGEAPQTEIAAVLLGRFFAGGIDLGREPSLIKELKKLVKGAPIVLCSKRHGDAHEFLYLEDRGFDEVLYPLPANFDRLQYRLCSRP